MASKRRIIPDLYFPEDDQELQTSSVEGQEGRGQGGEVKKKEPVDLTPEGFIPIHKLTLEDLPEPIRTEETLQYIMDESTRVVKVNNNGLSDLRPDDDEFKKKKQKSLTGSGNLLDNQSAVILTNRHVLFNEEELCKSTFDVFFDYHHGDKNENNKRFKRCVRTNGKGFVSKSSKQDIVQALYTVKDNMKTLIKDQCVDRNEMTMHEWKMIPHLCRVENKSTVVCLISHPLGQPKQVSFGKMVNYDMPSRTVHHTAPSKPGSSGGRVIVFSQSLFLKTIVHVGTELLDGERYKYARIFDFGIRSCLDFHVMNAHTVQEKEAVSGSVDFKSLVDIAPIFGQKMEAASGSVEIASLVAFVPIFGAFLSRGVETRLGGLDTSVLTPCQVLLTDKPWTSYELKQSVKEIIEMLAEVVPSTTPFPSSNPGDTSTLLSLLESQGPCYCQSIVKMMERGIKLEDGTVTECFLSPYTAAAKMSSDLDITWPWLKGRKSDIDKYDAKEGCLLRKCLKFADRDYHAVMLLLMIARANVDAKELHLKSGDPSCTRMEGDVENRGKTVYEQNKQEARLEQNTEKRHSETQHFSPLAEKVSCSAAEVERDWRRLTADVAFVLVNICTCLSFSTMFRIGNKDQNATSKQTESEDVSKLYSACLAVSDHAWQHEWQVHPDTEQSKQDGSNVNWCHCGRPETYGVTRAFDVLAAIVTAFVSTDVHVVDNKTQKFENCAKPQLVDEFCKFIEQAQQCAFDQSFPPETLIMTMLDKMNSFPRGRHSFMLFLAAREVLLYNLRLLARQISKHLQPVYFAFPVSVFGRPGNWPGNVTPPEVRRTAWRLIQDAIMASGFRPALLAALDKDAERREKLIDLYVDMKQLKWQGRIQPHLFWKHLECSRRDMEDHLQSGLPFQDPTHYFVWYACYLVCPQILTSQRSTLPQCPVM